MFLVNLSGQICFAVLSLLGFAACSILGARFIYFRRLARAYVFNGALVSVQSCFIDVMLCSCVQLKNAYFRS